MHNLWIDNWTTPRDNNQVQLHPNQVKLLKYLSGIEDLEGLSLWDIARDTGLNNAQTVSHHLKQLEKYGYIRRDLNDPNQFEVLKNPIEDVIYVNIFGYALCGNNSDFFSIENQKEKIAISTKLFGLKKIDNNFLMRAKGDSMSPDIEDKDLVLFEKQSNIEDGNIALVLDEGIPKIKKVFKKGNGEYILNSINKSHKDKLIKRNTNFMILGLGKGVIRGL